MSKSGLTARRALSNGRPQAKSLGPRTTDYVLSSGPEPKASCLARVSWSSSPTIRPRPP